MCLHACIPFCWVTLFGFWQKGKSWEHFSRKLVSVWSCNLTNVRWLSPRSFGNKQWTQQHFLSLKRMNSDCIIVFRYTQISRPESISHSIKQIIQDHQPLLEVSHFFSWSLPLFYVNGLKASDLLTCLGPWGLDSSHLYINGELNALWGSSQCWNRILPSSNEMFFLSESQILICALWTPHLYEFLFPTLVIGRPEYMGSTKIIQNNLRQLFN